LLVGIRVLPVAGHAGESRVFARQRSGTRSRTRRRGQSSRWRCSREVRADDDMVLSYLRSEW